jgi:hypothetical protein
VFAVVGLGKSTNLNHATDAHKTTSQPDDSKDAHGRRKKNSTNNTLSTYACSTTIHNPFYSCFLILLWSSKCVNVREEKKEHFEMEQKKSARMFERKQKQSQHCQPPFGAQGPNSIQIRLCFKNGLFAMWSPISDKQCFLRPSTPNI